MKVWVEVLIGREKGFIYCLVRSVSTYFSIVSFHAVDVKDQADLDHRF